MSEISAFILELWCNIAIFLPYPPYSKLIILTSLLTDQKKKTNVTGLNFFVAIFIKSWLVIFLLYSLQFMLQRNHLQRYISGTSNIEKCFNADDISKNIFQAFLRLLFQTFRELSKNIIADLIILWPFLRHQTTADERSIAAKAY